MFQREAAATKYLLFIIMRCNVRLSADILTEICELARKRNRDLGRVGLAHHPMFVRLDDVAGSCCIKNSIAHLFFRSHDVGCWFKISAPKLQ